MSHQQRILLKHFLMQLLAWCHEAYLKCTLWHYNIMAACAISSDHVRNRDTSFGTAFVICEMVISIARAPILCTRTTMHWRYDHEARRFDRALVDRKASYKIVHEIALESTIIIDILYWNFLCRYCKYWLYGLPENSLPLNLEKEKMAQWEA